VLWEIQSIGEVGASSAVAILVVHDCAGVVCEPLVAEPLQLHIVLEDIEATDDGLHSYKPFPVVIYLQHDQQDGVFISELSGCGVEWSECSIGGEFPICGL